MKEFKRLLNAGPDDKDRPYYVLWDGPRPGRDPDYGFVERLRDGKIYVHTLRRTYSKIDPAEALAGPFPTFKSAKAAALILCTEPI